MYINFIIDVLFQRMDTNHDGVISVEEFMDTCEKVEPNVLNLEDLFNSTVRKNVVNKIRRSHIGCHIRQSNMLMLLRLKPFVIALSIARKISILFSLANKLNLYTLMLIVNTSELS